MDINEEILSELKEMNTALKDLYWIRNGFYDPPGGSEPTTYKGALYSLDDIYEAVTSLENRVDAHADLSSEYLQRIMTSLESIDETLTVIRDIDWKLGNIEGDVSSISRYQ